MNKLPIIIIVIIFIILSMFILEYFNIDMDDNNGFNILKKKVIYEGIGNKNIKL